MKTERVIIWVIGVLVVLYLIKQSGVLTGLQSSSTYSGNTVDTDPGGTGAGDLLSALQEYDGSGDD